MTATDHTSAGLVEVPADRWPMIFTLLSMDVVAAFSDLMGLSGIDVRRMVSVVRREILRVRYAFAAGDPKVRGGPDEFFRAIEGEVGSAEASRLKLWILHIFARDMPAHRPLSLWMEVMRVIRKQPTLLTRLGLPAQRSPEIREELDRAFELDEYEQRAQEIGGRVLSDWDLHMYAVVPFDDDDPGAPNGPDSYVYGATDRYRGYRFWAYVLRTFDPPTVNRLHVNALALRGEIAELKWIDELVHPSALNIGLLLSAAERAR